MGIVRWFFLVELDGNCAMVCLECSRRTSGRMPVYKKNLKFMIFKICGRSLYIGNML